MDSERIRSIESVARHTKAVKEKLRALKGFKFETQRVMYEVLQPEVDPLNASLNLKQAKHKKAEEEKEEDENEEQGEESEEPAQEDIASYIEKIRRSGHRELDTTYGVRYEFNSNWLGNKAISFDGSDYTMDLGITKNTVFDWVRDHRVHHKFSETDADPHNSGRGFFFAHVGWLMQKKHPEVLRRGKLVDMSDVLADPLVAFHHRYFSFFKLLFCFVIPICIPPLCWGDSWYYSAIGMGVVRYVLSLNFTWLVNSAAHIWGNKPYDRRISPAENLSVAFLALGEGWHNYHHVFPWDYKAAELGRYFNLTTLLIDLFSKIGWAYDLKTPSKQLVRRVAQRYGDGTHSVYGNEEISEHEDAVSEPELPQVSQDD